MMEHRNLVWLLDPGTNEPLEPHRVLTDAQTASYTRDHHYRIVLEFRGCSTCPPDREWHEHPDSDDGDNTLCWVSPPNNRDGLACLLQWRHSAAHVFTRPPTAEGHEDAGPCPWEAYDGETRYTCPLYADHAGLHQAAPDDDVETVILCGVIDQADPERPACTLLYDHAGDHRYPRCPTCNDEGIVHDMDGTYRGPCDCPAGKDRRG